MTRLDSAKAFVISRRFGASLLNVVATTRTVEEVLRWYEEAEIIRSLSSVQSQMALRLAETSPGHEPD